MDVFKAIQQASWSQSALPIKEVVYSSSGIESAATPVTPPTHAHEMIIRCCADRHIAYRLFRTHGLHIDAFGGEPRCLGKSVNRWIKDFVS